MNEYEFGLLWLNSCYFRSFPSSNLMLGEDNNREFFKLDPVNVIAVLKLLRVDDITQQFEQKLESDVPTEDKQSAQAFKRSMRPAMNSFEGYF